MRIRSVTPLWISLPLTEPLKLANHVIEAADNLLVRVEDSDGHIGWGEASSAPTMTGETPEGMLAAVRFMAPFIEGMEVEDISGFAHRIDALMYGNAAAKSALDMAIYDLAGKRAKAPVAELLGGVVREKIPVLWMLAANKLGPDVAAAQRMGQDGFVAFKVKIGGASPDADLARSAAVRGALGEGARISADANQGYSRDAAIHFAMGAEAAGLDFIEQPVAWNDIESMAAVAAATPVPVGTDEGVHSIEDIEKHHARQAARGASLKTIKLGGLSPVMEAGRRMHTLGMHVNLAGKIADSSIASAAILHLAAALPQLDWDVSITCQYLAQDIAREPLRIVQGHAYVTDRPGLGVEVDESRLSGLSARRLAA